MIINPNSPSIHSISQFNHFVHQSRYGLLGVKDALFTADQLIRHGYYDGARRVIDKLAERNYKNETFNRRLSRLTKSAEQVRTIPQIDEMLADSNKMKSLLSLQSTIHTTSSDSKHLIIVYATAWNNFDISFPVLHSLISKHAGNVLYVKNPKRGIYANGNDKYGSSIDEMSSTLCTLIRTMNPSKLTVMGFSGGGYAALHLAIKVKADVFLGFGIRTDLSRDCTFTKSEWRTSHSESDYENNTLINIKDHAEIMNIKKAVLYFGDRDKSDQEHALNMLGLPNFTIHTVHGGSHNLLMDFLWAGQLQKVLNDILN